MIIKMKLFAGFCLAVLITSCGSWNPVIGMTEQELYSMYHNSVDGCLPRLVGAEGNQRTLMACSNFYYFVDGRLQRIDQGILPEERIRITIDQ
jgi:hypothetical protein